MKELLKKSGLTFLLLFGTLALAGCEDNNLEDAADEVGDAVEDAADDVEDAVN